MASKQQLEALVAEFCRGLRSPSPRDPRALASVALCVGGLVLARAVAEEGLAEQILAAAREGVAENLGKEADEVGRRAASRRRA